MMKEMPNPGKGDAVLFGFVREHCKAEYELIGKGMVSYHILIGVKHLNFFKKRIVEKHPLFKLINSKADMVC